MSARGGAAAALAMLLLVSARDRRYAAGRDRLDVGTAAPRAVHVRSWPGGKKVAVCFVLYVEEWGPRSGSQLFAADMTARSPDIVNESFRRYAIDFGVERVGQAVPRCRRAAERRPSTRSSPNAIRTFGVVFAPWPRRRRLSPSRPQQFHRASARWAKGLNAQRGLCSPDPSTCLERDTGVRSQGLVQSQCLSQCARPSPPPAAEGGRLTPWTEWTRTRSRKLTDAIRTASADSPIRRRRSTWGQYLTRGKEPADLERLWIDYVDELVSEAEADPARDATVVAIGLHPFVVGTPAGAAAMRRVLRTLLRRKMVWITDVEAVVAASR